MEKKQKPKRKEVVAIVQPEPLADRFKYEKLQRSSETFGVGYKSPAKAPKDEQYYVTTAIMYTNGNPHIGHAYEVVLADFAARFNRMFENISFLAGAQVFHC